MFNLFKRHKEPTKLYAGLPPAERITKLFEEKAEPALSQYGYKFLKSKLLFKRRVGPLTHEISVSKSKWNKADEVCSFWLVFTIYADTYDDWHKEKYGTLPLNNVVTGFYHNHLKSWKTQYPLDKYNLSKQDNEEVFEEIIGNLEKVVLPMLNEYSDYGAAANTLMREKQYWMAAMIYDFYLMAGNSEKAKEVLQKGKEFFAKQPDSQKEFLDAFKVRLQEL